MLVIDTLELTEEDLEVLAATAVVLAQSNRLTLQQLANALDALNKYEKDKEASA